MTYTVLGNNDLQGDPQVNGYSAPGPPAEATFGNGVKFRSRTIIERGDGLLEVNGGLFLDGGFAFNLGLNGQVTDLGSATAGLAFGSAADVSLVRPSSGFLRSSGDLGSVASYYAQHGTAGQVQVGNSNATPGIIFGLAGNTSNLYLNSNGVLRSDGGLILAGATFLANGGSGITLSFFGSGGAGRQTIAGAKGGNAALASLLAALAAHGLITDTTTA